MPATPDQLRAARELLRLEQADLARRAHTSLATIRRLEAPNGQQRVAPTILRTIQVALEQAGAEFIPNGVRRRQPGPMADPTLLEDLRAISLRSATRVQAHPMLTDADLYDENGLPA